MRRLVPAVTRAAVANMRSEMDTAKSINTIPRPIAETQPSGSTMPLGAGSENGSFAGIPSATIVRTPPMKFITSKRLPNFQNSD